jgi:hypothetical protein
VPSVKNERWPQTPIDAFVLAKLEQKGLTPSERADKRTLLRRVTFDLTGLPPTDQEVNAFVSDTSPDAFPQVVERLLASPHYGERWGRHWLDVARYSDTKGYVFEEERRYPYAYTYRDYVIRAFNEDLPFDRFIIEQLAADQLPLGDDKRPLAAMGFLTLGRRFLNNQADIIDDRIDVVSRGLMGLTVGCARCHDHKYDPIPTKDYYSLYGVFASSSEPSEKPTLGSDSLPPAYPDYLAERKKRQNELDEFRNSKGTEAMRKLRAQVGDYLLVVHDMDKLTDSGKQENLARQRKLEPRVVRRWRNVLGDLNKETNSIFSPWFAFASLSETNFADAAKDLAESINANAQQRVNPRIASLFDQATPPNALTNVAELYNRVFAEVDKQWLAAKTNTPALTALPDPTDEALRQVLYGSGLAFDLSRDEVGRHAPRFASARYGTARQPQANQPPRLHPRKPQQPRTGSATPVS